MFSLFNFASGWLFERDGRLLFGKGWIFLERDGRLIF
jgi:hypothetical protein